MSWTNTNRKGKFRHKDSLLRKVL